MVQKKIIIGIFLMFLTLYGICEEGEKKEEQSIIVRWRETLLYGIAEEVLETVKDIEDAKETSLNSELVKVLSESINTEVRNEILNYFIVLEYKGGESVALALLSESEDFELDTLLVSSLINYLAAIRSTGINEMLTDFIEDEDDRLSETALRAIGKMNDTSKVEYLLELLDDPEFPEERKPTLILIFGDLKAVSAVPALIEIVKDTFEDRVYRMYACDSLGKIGDTRAIPVLKKAFSETDALLRAYAASALSKFNMADVIGILVQGLKDDNWRVRYHCAVALTHKDAVGAVDILKYKAKKDPVKKVRIAAIQALGEIGTKQCFDFIRELFSEKIEALDIRDTCCDTLIDKDLAGSIETINTVINEAWNGTAYEFKIIDMCAKKLSVTKSILLKKMYKKFLICPNLYIRVYGIRGIALNRILELKKDIEKLSKDDPSSLVQREALAALSKM